MTELEPLPDELQRLLAAERRSEDAPAAAQDRVLMRLGGTFGLGASMAAGAATAPAPAGAGARALGRAGHVAGAVRLARVATIFVAGAATGVGGQHAVHHLRAKAAARAQVGPRRPTPAPQPPPAAEPAPPTPAQALPSERPAVHSHRPALPAASDPPAAGDDRLGAERALLEIARAALARGDAEGALAALARHEATFPRGELTEEREGLSVPALVAARRYDDARARAARFSRRYPRSLFAPVVAQALGSIP